jgi:integrase
VEQAWNCELQQHGTKGKSMATKRSQFGTIEKLPSGKFRARYKVEGIWHSASTTFKNKTDAQNFLATIQSDIIREVWRAPANNYQTLDDYASEWITTNSRIKETTRELYVSTWNRHIKPHLGDLRLQAVSSQAVRKWHDLLKQSLKAELEVKNANRRSSATVMDGSSTVARSYRLLHAIFATAVDDEIIERNPCRLQGAGIAKSAERPTLSVQEVGLLAQTVPARYRALILLLAWTGIRIGEAAALTREDLFISDENSWVSINKRVYKLNSGLDLDAPKSAAGTRTIALPPHIVDDLEAHLDTYAEKSQQGLVFVTSLGNNIRSSYHGMIFNALSKIDRTDMRPHDLRHTGMTLAAEVGASLPELKVRLGQSSTAAANKYLHATRSHGQAISMEMSRLATQTSNAIYGHITNDGQDAIMDVIRRPLEQ